jgi:hypothetical protein
MDQNNACRRGGILDSFACLAIGVQNSFARRGDRRIDLSQCQLEPA